MARVKIVTDSAAYFEPGDLKGLDVEIVPIGVRFGDELYRDGIDLTREEFFRRLERSSAPPVTTPPSIETFQEVYTRLRKTTDQILSLHVSSRLSQTYDHATLAAESLLGRCQIFVVDSLSTSLSLGILVAESAKLAAAGSSLDEIVRMIRGVIPHLYIVFFVETMDYLERNGRIGKAQAILGSMLNIKPFLFVEDGEVIPLEKVRTRAKALDKLFEFAAEFSNIERMAIIQRDPRPNEETNTLTERLLLTFPGISVPIIQYDPVLACHVGPDAMGIVVYERLD
jgi:DegV family protein with EDD domain